MERKNTVYMVYLKDLLFAALYRWRSVLCTALVAALLLGGVKAGTATMELKNNKDENSAGKIAWQAYEAERQSLAQQVDILDKGLASQQTYVAESALLKLDPYGFYEATLRIFVDTGWTSDDKTADKTPAVLSAYTTTLVQKAHLEQLGELVGIDDHYVAELITVTVASDNSSVLVSVMSATSQDAQTMAQYLQDQLPVAQNTVSELVCAHTASATLTPARLRLDTKLADTQKAAVERVTTLQSSLLKAQNKLKELVPPDGVYTSAAQVAKDTVVFFVVGLVAGAVIAALYACVKHIACPKVYSARLLTERTGIKVLACAGVTAGKTRFDRYLQKAEGRSTGEQPELLTAFLRNRCASAAPVLVVCDEKAGLPLASTLQSALPQLQMTVCQNLLTDASALDMLGRSKCVMLIVKCHASRYDKIEKQIQLIADCGKELAGCVLIDG